MKRILTILLILISCSVSAQTGTADTIYVDVPAEVEGLRMQTTECISVGKKDKERFGKKFLGYSFMHRHGAIMERNSTRRSTRRFLRTSIIILTIRLSSMVSFLTG